ncbi:MAG: alpha/beta hydrolase [Helicobacter sp.]|nr:alpha/beta hydrolase [Helicobacter sp.]
MALRQITALETTFEISYIADLKDAKKTIIFLHGWGSNKKLMQLSFGKYFKDFDHYYIDLPGFGESTNPKILNTKDYAKILQNFFKELDITPDLIVGHSFGGKIAALLDAEMILLSAAGIITKKSLKTRLKISLAKTLKKLKLPNNFLKSSDADGLNNIMYETFKNVVNEDFSDIYKNFGKKASIFWGQNDFTTPISSGRKIAYLIKNSRFFELSGDHYFFIKQGDLIERLYKQDL